MSAPQRCVYIATLGGQPQVVTLALDRLLARGAPIDEVVVVHLASSAPRALRALNRLAEAFADERYAGRPLRYRPLAVAPAALAPGILHGEQALYQTLDSLQHLICQIKAVEGQIHLCVAGGRRLLGMLALTTAMLYFDRGDAIWHLASSDEVCRQTADGAVLHLPLDAEVHLVRLPVEPWGHLFPMLRGQSDPALATTITRQRSEHEAQHRARCAQVVARLTDRQREVLAALVAGMTIQEISERLCIVISTVHAHKKQIFAECAVAWALAPDTRADAHWLRTTFHEYSELDLPGDST